MPATGDLPPLSNATQARLVVVLGMHRSGTSAVTRALQALGVALGENLLPPVPEQNARGFFEDVEVVNLDDRLLTALGRRWHTLAPVSAAHWGRAEVAELKPAAQALLEKRLSHNPLWGLKDPRLCRLLPFWQPLFARAQAEVQYVVVLRNPASVARSLAVRNGFAAEKGYLLWLAHMAETMLHTAGRPRVVVDYDRLLARPAAELNRLAAALGLVVDGETERRIAAYAGEFLSRELRHSEYDRQALAGDPRCPSSALKAYDALACLAGAQGEPTDEQWLWRALDGELRRFAPALSYADAAESQLDAVAQAEKRDAVPSAASAAVRTKEAAPARRGLTAGPRARPPGADEATVSVVIPLYNHERYIEAALTSVLEQTLPPKEIIVVDDGSTDASVAIVRQLAAQEPRIVFWSQPNQGAHRTLNAALHRATGEFVAVLNSDDRYQRERLAICVGHLRRNPQAEAVATALTCIDAEGLSMPSSWYAAALAFYRASGNLALALMHGNFLLTTSNLVARRSLFDAVGYFAPLRYVHDLEFFLRLGIHGRQLDFIDTPLLDYRLHERNTIAENRGRSEIEEAAVFAWFLQFGTGFAGGSDDAWPGRYIETLAQRDLLDPVEYFFALLAGESQPEAPSGWPESALRHALARLGVDCAGAMPAASRLAEFVHARNAHLRRWHRLDGDTVMLDAFAGQQRTAAQMRAGIERQGRELLERGAQVERQGKEIERLNALAEARSRELLERGAQVERQGKEIERLNALAEARSREMVSLLASHWHRLGRALHGEPASLRAAASTVYHLAACLMPRRCRPWLEARAARLAARFAQHAH